MADLGLPRQATPATSASGLGPTLPSLNTETGPTPFNICTVAGMGSPLPPLHRDWAQLRPHLHRGWAHPCHICTVDGVTHGMTRATERSKRYASGGEPSSGKDAAVVSPVRVQMCIPRLHSRLALVKLCGRSRATVGDTETFCMGCVGVSVDLLHLQVHLQGRGADGGQSWSRCGESLELVWANCTLPLTPSAHSSIDWIFDSFSAVGQTSVSWQTHGSFEPWCRCGRVAAKMWTGRACAHVAVCSPVAELHLSLNRSNGIRTCNPRNQTCLLPRAAETRRRGSRFMPQRATQPATRSGGVRTAVKLSPAGTLNLAL